MSLFNFIFNYKVLIFFGCLLVNSIICDFEKLDLILLPKNKSKIVRYKRVPKLDIHQYDRLTEIPDIDHFDYISHSYDVNGRFHDDKEKSKFYFKSKEKSPAVFNKLNNLRDACKYLKRIEQLKRAGAGDNVDSYYHGLPPKGKLLLAQPRITDLPASDSSKQEDDYVEHSYDDYKDKGINRIVGGYNVEISLYPYHVGYGVNCGGAIIDEKWVLTAGHCGTKKFITAGSKVLNQGIRIQVKNNYIHPRWSSEIKEHPFDYDFQLVELDTPLKFSNVIQPVKVGRLEDMTVGKIITVTGWGNIKENGKFSNTLRAVRVPIISKAVCQQVTFPYFRGQLTSRMFCAGFREGKKDACQGDSGGPAVSNDRLLGMVSFGYGCATPGSYGVYSKVAKVRGWIESTTGIILE